MQRTRSLILLAVVPVLAAAAAPAAGPTTYTIDPVASQVVIHVDKSGMFSFLGHAHEVTAPVAEGTVVLDRDAPERSTVRVEFEASALRVTGKGEPPGDIPEVQRTMESARVLDAARFPRMSFTSRGIRVIARDEDRLRLTLTGDFTLHGVTRSATVDVSAEIGRDRLTADGKLVVKQTDFGIEPVSAGAGTVRVKNEVQVEFTFVARPGAERR